MKCDLIVDAGSNEQNFANTAAMPQSLDQTPTLNAKIVHFNGCADANNTAMEVITGFVHMLWHSNMRLCRQ